MQSHYNLSNRAQAGHPTQFLKIIHYAIFGSSPIVRDHLFANGIDKDVIHLNDMKFFKIAMNVLVSVFYHTFLYFRSLSLIHYICVVDKPFRVQGQDHAAAILQVWLRRD